MGRSSKSKSGAKCTPLLHKKTVRHAPCTLKCCAKPVFLLHDDFSFPVELAPHPALSPRRCKQGWCNSRGEDERRGDMSILCNVRGNFQPATEGTFLTRRLLPGALAQANRVPKRSKGPSAAKPQPNGVRPSSGAETWDAWRCGSNPEREALPQLLRPGTAALRKISSQLANNFDDCTAVVRGCASLGELFDQEEPSIAREGKGESGGTVRGCRKSLNELVW